MRRKAWLTSAEVMDILEIKAQTLYAYVSRGLVRTAPAPEGRASLYAREDVEALQARRKARAGHGPAAAGALRWGEPVLESAITEIHGGGLRYRGHDVASLVARGVPFESVAELLWSGLLPSERPRWEGGPPAIGEADGDALGTLARGVITPRALAYVLAKLAARDDRDGEVETIAGAVARARRAILGMAAHAAFPRKGRPGGRSVGEHLLRSAGVPVEDDRLAAVEKALVACADHELNASTFAARVAASTGARLYPCLQAGLAALSGARHGGATLQAETFVRELASPRAARAALDAAFAARDEAPGFGHRLYADGDPRTPALLDAARAVARGGGDAEGVVARVDALIAAMRRREGPAPTLDLGLVAVAAAVGLPPGGAYALFAVGRLAGWTAHVLEQWQQGVMLRPRARYVGRRAER